VIINVRTNKDKNTRAHTHTEESFNWRSFTQNNLTSTTYIYSIYWKRFENRVGGCGRPLSDIGESCPPAESLSSSSSLNHRICMWSMSDYSVWMNVNWMILPCVCVRVFFNLYLCEHWLSQVKLFFFYYTFSLRKILFVPIRNLKLSRSQRPE